MAMFNSYDSHYQRVYTIHIPLNHHKIPVNHHTIPLNHHNIPLNIQNTIKGLFMAVPNIALAWGAVGSCPHWQIWWLHSEPGAGEVRSVWERCIQLVGGLEHFLFSKIYWKSSSDLTNIFQMGWNHQPDNMYTVYLVNGWLRDVWNRKSH